MTSQLPSDLRLIEMSDEGNTYLLVFSTEQSDYEDWISRLGAPDVNARLLIKLLGGKGTLVDVGANIGTISVPLAKRGSKVIAIEMLPTNCLKLWSAAFANRLKTLQIIQTAASDRDGIITYQGQGAMANVYAEANGTPALCLRLDGILQHLGPIEGPFVLKIDVEGHELHVLRGAAETIAAYRPLVLFESIQIEGLDHGNAKNSRHFLESQGYKLFLCHGDILSPKSADDLQEGHVVDFLAVPKERIAELASLGLTVRPLRQDERLVWIDEMARFSMENHQRHAAGVLLRWRKEDPAMWKKAQHLTAVLIEAPHLSDLHAGLR